MTEPQLKPKYESYLRKKNALINQIIDLRRRAAKHKALLSLKYETLNIRINVIQVSVIFFSVTIALLESLKSIFDLKELIWDVIPIFISTYITLVMAILRFFKWEVQKENISKCHENHTYIINKLEKMYNTIICFEWESAEKSDEKWKNIVSTFEDELFDNFVSAKQTFDTILTYKDIIHYKEKYKKLYLKMEFSNQDIELIRRGSDMEHKNYMKPNSWYMRFFCCKPEKSLDVEHFLRDAYQTFGIVIDHNSMISSNLADSYEQYDKEYRDAPKDSMIINGNGNNNNQLVVDSMVSNGNQNNNKKLVVDSMISNDNHTGHIGNYMSLKKQRRDAVRENSVNSIGSMSEEGSKETTPLLEKETTNVINSLDETINNIAGLVKQSRSIEIDLAHSPLLPPMVQTTTNIVEDDVRTKTNTINSITSDYSLTIDDNN